jgi:hypothetical protein
MWPALWNAIPTAGVTIVDQGNLNEDVSGQNVVPGPAAGAPTNSQPSDSAASAGNCPVAVIFDADGAVLDSVFGASTSDPTNCETDDVVVVLDNINPDATVVHAFMILNGRLHRHRPTDADDELSARARLGPCAGARAGTVQSANVAGVAATGNTSTLAVAIEQHP